MGRPPGDTAAATKLRLLLAAEQEFAEHGYQRATISAIARRAGVTDGTLLYHVRSKSELFSLTVQQASLDIIEALTDALGRPGTLRSRLAVLAETAKALHVRPSRAALFAALPTEVRWNPELAAVSESVRGPLRQAFAAIAADAVAHGELPSSVTEADAAAMVESFVAGLGAASAVNQDPGRFSAVMDAYIATLSRA